MIDASSITTAVSAISTALTVSKAALQLRDFNSVTAEIAKINQMLLEAQSALFKHNATLFGLQQEHFETSEKLRKATESLAERGRYSLVEVGNGHFTYRVNIAPVDSGAVQPISAQRAHYVCQRCFDSGTKVVLQRNDSNIFGRQLSCPSCKTTYNADLLD